MSGDFQKNQMGSVKIWGGGEGKKDWEPLLSSPESEGFFLPRTYCFHNLTQLPCYRSYMFSLN